MILKFPRALLPAAVLLQAILLLPNLALLPVWGDEQFTLSTVVQDVPGILRAVRADVHPPLYYLLAHYWLLLPLPGSPIERIRLLSVLFALLSTLAIDRAWAAKLMPGARLWFYSLWCLSPFLLLYARMGRSYSLQLLLSCFALRYGWEAIRSPARIQSIGLYILWSTTLLYTHYLPGVAIPAAVAVVGCWRHRRRWSSASTIVGIHGAIVALYVPWFTALSSAAHTAVASGDYRVTSGEILEHGVRIAYTFLAATFGETMPVWGYLFAAVAAPGVLWLLGVGTLRRPEWLWLLPIVALVAYSGAAAGVIFSLTPARLMFLLPFYLFLIVMGQEQRPVMGTACLVLVLSVSAAGITSYYRRENYLNKGYVLPLDRIASEAARDLPLESSVIIVDGSNTQPTPLVAALPASLRRIVSLDARSIGTVRTTAADPSARHVWFLRNTHDITPEQVNTMIENELDRSFSRVGSQQYVAYSAIDRAAMTLLRWPTKPGYVLELLKYERRP